VKIEKCIISKQLQPHRASIYSYDPSQDTSYLQRYLHVQGRKYQRDQLVEVLLSYHTPELLHPAIERNLDRLRSPDSVVVIGGQQAGILTGPLYTIYKVITIIQLAKREEERLQKPVIPVFWIAGEDHDRQEVDHLYIPQETSMVKRVFPISTEKKTAVSAIMLDPDTVRLWLNELHQELSDREHKADWVSLCEELTSEPISWTRFFARIMHYLFASYGLLLIDSQDFKLRELEQPYFEQLLDHNGALGDAVERGIQTWGAVAGVSSPLQFEEQQAHLFIEHEGTRVALYREGATFRSRNHFFCFSLDELRTRHLQLSNNVATRPIMQEMVFPVLAFVGGPAEVDYWGCLGEAFELFGLEMPVIYPRQSVTLVESRIEKYRATWGILWDSLLAGEGQAIIGDWKQDHIPPILADQFAQFVKQLRGLHGSFLQELTQMVGGNIAQLGEVNQKKLIDHIDWLQQKTYAQINNRQETDLRQHREVMNAVYPLAGWQERSYNLVTFWNAYGLEWLHMLCKQELPDINTHQLLFI
jgi:bacillithiol synthase